MPDRCLNPDEPIIKCAQTTHQAKIGSSIDISCSIQSNPSSNITWLEEDGIAVIDKADPGAGITINEEVIAVSLIS